MKKLFFLLLSLFLLSSNIFADDIFVIIAKKQEEKKKYSWSLTDWMLTKKKIALMDQWLAFHSSPENFEFSLAGYEQKYKTQTASSTGTSEDLKKTQDSVSLAAYYKIFGLSYDYGYSNEETSFYAGQFNLRIFGRSIQATNITTFVGRAHFNKVETYDPWYWGVSGTVYLLPFLGIDATYRSYLKAENKETYSQLQGHKTELGTFVDVFLLRLCASYNKEVFDIERQRNLSSPSNSTETRESWQFGVKIFF